MIDCGCWVLETGEYVIRLQGRELKLSPEDAMEFSMHLNSVLNHRLLSSVSAAYEEAARDRPEPSVPLITNLIEVLGLIKREPLRRRV